MDAELAAEDLLQGAGRDPFWTFLLLPPVVTACCLLGLGSGSLEWPGLACIQHRGSQVYATRLWKTPHAVSMAVSKLVSKLACHLYSHNPMGRSCICANRLGTKQTCVNGCHHVCSACLGFRLLAGPQPQQLKAIRDESTTMH